MRKSTTPNTALRTQSGWLNRLGNGSSRWFNPLGLILMFFALFVPNIASAEIVTTTYDFKSEVDNNRTTVSYSSTLIEGCNYFTQLGNLENPGRLAAQGANKFSLFRHGLYNNNSGARNFVIDNLSANDVVEFSGMVANTGGNTDVELVSSNATKSGNTFTLTARGRLIVKIAKYTWIGKITIQHDNSASWNYDPAVETYDIYYVPTQSIQSNNLIPADFPLDYDDLPAQYLTNLQGGMALNKRIAISQVMYQGNTITPWTLQNYGGLKSLYNWHNFAICNLMEGDRVVIQIWTGSAKFSSKAENMAYNGCSAFLDVENNGDFDTGDDTEITCGMDVQNLATYVITEDGHLDIALSADAIFCKVYIYGDHQARMVDDLDSTPVNGQRSYFDRTGQLEAKHHIVPGGLHVYVGNQNEAHHAEVVSSDEGPVSFVYDEKHFKTPNLANNSFNLWYDLPKEGTFYKFVPEVDGKMTVRFKANSVNYRDWYNHEGNVAVDQAGTPNETNPNVECPYYLFDGDGLWASRDRMQRKGNGATVTFEDVVVTAGKEYYLYGWWDDTNNYTQYNNHACGVAELIDVTFKPDQFVYPLAKWVESGATADKLSDLADVQGYNANDVFIKKKSENIESCSAAIVNGKLKITNITYKAGTNPGGVVLIKVGDRNIATDPVFALTIAYDAAFNPQEVGKDKNGNSVKKSEGYTWNFSDYPLHGLKWNNIGGEADVTEFGTHFNNYATATLDDDGIPTNGTNGNSFLTEEINHGDWTFNYRVKKSKTEFYDPRFLNNYPVEGDNADMMWETGGIVIYAGSNLSCIFNEFSRTNDKIVNHDDKEQGDPDRYVGFLPGSKFIIPCLKKDDRVVIYMGSGYGSGKESMTFNITNARDAVYKAIAPTDDYHIGGSLWNVRDEANGNHHDDPYYRGCYHFFAQEDGDMEFEMVKGSMCKLYTIKIYRGARENTNGVQEAGGGYTILAEKDQDGNLTKSETKYWNLHFRGKGEDITDGRNNIVNEVLVHSGNITHCNNSDIIKSGTGQISYTNQGEIGMLRVRVKGVDYDNKYVTDFADRNLTLALHETMKYPYTWDFTDVDHYSSAAVENEYNNFNEITEFKTDKTDTDGSYSITGKFEQNGTWYEPLGRELSIWDENGAMVVRASTEEYNNQNMLFENCKGINGNQLWANNNVIPETRGLWWYMDNNDPAYNASMQITEDGLRVANTKRQLDEGATTSTTMGWWNYKMVVPSVPKDHVVYLRMERDLSVQQGDYSQKPNENPVYFFMTKFNFGTAAKTNLTTDDGNVPQYSPVINSGDYSFYNVKDADGQETNDWIVAVKNTTGAASNLTFTLNGWILKKMSISEDWKSLDSNGWATESRKHVVDPSLTAFLTGYDIETCFVKEIQYNENKPHLGGQIKLVRANFEDSSSGDIVRASKTGDMGGCILHNTAEEPVKILNDGFHLFVPDMHDYLNEGSGDYTSNDIEGVKTITGTNLLKAQVDAGDIPATEGDYTNYILSNRRYKSNEGDGTLEEYIEAFYRVSTKKAAHSNGNNAYLQLLTSKVTNQSSANGYKLVFEFENDADGISEVTDTNVDSNANNIYSIDGKKLEGMPTSSGLYIINGKKVVIK